MPKNRACTGAAVKPCSQSQGEARSNPRKRLVRINSSAESVFAVILSRMGIFMHRYGHATGRQIFLTEECFLLRHVERSKRLPWPTLFPISMACYHERMRGVCRRIWTWTWSYFVIFKPRGPAMLSFLFRSTVEKRSKSYRQIMT
jgi:hypothetical protein